MKRLLALILAAALAISLVACGGGGGTVDNSVSSGEIEDTASTNTPSDGEDSATAPQVDTSTTPDEPINWCLIDKEDDFGDKTGQKVLLGLFTGSFRNTATLDSELKVAVGCYIKTLITGSGSGRFYLNLFEYGDNRVTFTSSEAENMSLRMKIDNTEQEYALICYPPYSSFFFESDDGAAAFGNALCNGDVIKCVMDIGSSRYNFDIDGTGFFEKYSILCNEYYPQQIETQMSMLEPTLLEKKWISDQISGESLIFIEGGQVDVYEKDGSYETCEWTPFDDDNDSTGIIIKLQNNRRIILHNREQDGETVLREEYADSNNFYVTSTYRAYSLDSTKESIIEEFYNSIEPLLLNKKWVCNIPENGSFVFLEDGNVEDHKPDGTITACKWEAVTDEMIRVIFSNGHMDLNIEYTNGEITMLYVTHAGEIITAYTAQPIK